MRVELAPTRWLLPRLCTVGHLPSASITVRAKNLCTTMPTIRPCDAIKRGRLCLKIVRRLRHLRMSVTGTPFPFLSTPTLNSTDIISYSAFLTPSTPVTPTPGSNRGRKRKNKENQLPTHIPSKKAKVDLTDLEKVRMFYGFIKGELGWTYSETLQNIGILGQPQ